MALLWQSATLIQHSESYISDAFVNSRLGSNHCQMYGALSKNTEFEKIIQRANPNI
jgi:hypothetical protein